MIYLRYNTASQEIPLGRFVDSTDGDTEETGLSIANTDIKLWKTGATTLASKNSGGATHVANGVYYCVLDATDTDTLGPMVVYTHPTGALACELHCVVLPAMVYDAMVAGSDVLQADVTQIGGSAVSTSSAQLGVNVVNFGGSAGTFASGRPEVNATHLAGTDVTAAGAQPYLGILDQGTAQSATASTLVLRSAAAFADDELNGAIAVITGGSAGVGQVRVITDYVSSTDTATISPDFTTTPSGTVTYKVFAAPPAPTASGSLPQVTVAEILQAALADLFNTDSGTTYASAVAGSVVAEIADNAVGAAGLDAAGVRSAVGLASANLDTQLAGLDTKIGTPVADLATDIAGVGTGVDLIQHTLTWLAIQETVVGATGNDTTHVHVPAWTFGDDEINNWMLAIYDADQDEVHLRFVEDWVNATKLATVATLPFTPTTSGDLVVLIAFRQDVTGGSGLDAAGVRSALGLASANLDTQLGGLDTKIGTPAVDLAADLAVVDGNVDSILADTADMQPKLGTPAGASLSADVAAVKADTAAVLDDTGTSGVVVSATAIRSAVGMAAADLDTQLAAIQTEADKIGTPAGASVSADVAAVKVDTAAILVDTGTSGVVVDDSTPILVDVRKINNAAVNGDGSGTPWGP